MLSPEFVTLCQTAIDNVQKAHKLLSSKGSDAFLERTVFPETNKILSQIDKDNVVIIERQTCMTAHFGGDNNVSLAGYRMRGSVETALEICHCEFLNILSTLEESLRVRFNPIIENPVFKSAASFLDTKSYSSIDIKELSKAASVLVEALESLLEANGFNPDALQTEINLLYTHVVQFLSNCSPDKCWQRLFKIKETLGIKNVLHLAEISLVIPLSNAEAERVYSFLWRVYTKERTRLNNSTLEDILRVRGDRDYSDEKYEKAIELFMTNNPDGTERKRTRRPAGHNYPSNRKTTKKSVREESQVAALSELVRSSDEEEVTDYVNVEDIPLSDISLSDSSDGDDSDPDCVSLF